LRHPSLATKRGGASPAGVFLGPIGKATFLLAIHLRDAAMDLASIADQMKMSREHALLGNYEAS
jgi:hypothetical protein